jgi:S1-C subfamily serine protease
MKAVRNGGALANLNGESIGFNSAIRSISLGGLLLSFVCCTAVASGETGPHSSSEADATVVPCALALPGNITAALICPDKALAMRALDEAGCFLPNSLEAMEVRRIWLRRESLAADAAGRDPVVQALMANCLVESVRDVGALGPAEASAVAFLRQALNEPSRGIVGIALHWKTSGRNHKEPTILI